MRDTSPLLVAAATALVVAYLGAARVGRGRPWPRLRSLSWALGVAVATVAVAAPYEQSAHQTQHLHPTFVDHMVGHVLLGMVAPTLLVLAAPITVLLRVVPAPTGRAISRVLRSVPVRVVTDPAVAALLDVGGLWVLYTTDLFRVVHTSPAVSALVHVHVLAAGCLFTAAVLAVDPMPHRRSFRYRSAVLVVALAAHDILAKHLYAHPPTGVVPGDGAAGAVVMYYGGDAVDVLLIVLLLSRWSRSARARDGSRGAHRMGRPPVTAMRAPET